MLSCLWKDKRIRRIKKGKTREKMCNNNKKKKWQPLSLTLETKQATALLKPKMPCTEGFTVIHTSSLLHLAMGDNCLNIIRPKKNICVFQVSRPYLGFWPDPKHFIVLKKNCIQNKKKKKKKEKRKMLCVHKTYGSILFLRDRFFFHYMWHYSNEIEEFLGHCLAHSWR